MKIPLALLWLLIAGVAWYQIRHLDVPFNRSMPGKHLRELLHKKKPAPWNPYRERILDEALADWKLTGPVRVALPPMYADERFGNAGFLSSFVNHGEVMLYNEPYPYPKLTIEENALGASHSGVYRFENHSTNAALYVNLGTDVWPLGYSAWYDFVMRTRIVDVPTPRLVGAGGAIIWPTEAHTIHRLNRVQIYGDITRAEMEHESPIVWTFPSEGRLESKEPGFVLESIPDGAEVSYLPPLPSVHERPFAMFLLAERVAPTDSPAPQWWPLDERFRRAVLANRPVAERRAILRQLAALYPTHPFLTHYRIIAELGGDRFDQTWLRAQTAQCELPSWYLVAWTHLPWRAVRSLPCLAKIPESGPLDGTGDYLAGSSLLAFRAERDDAELQQLAQRIIDRSNLDKEFRGFNYPPSDFAWLWLKARP